MGCSSHDYSRSKNDIVLLPAEAATDFIDANTPPSLSSNHANDGTQSATYIDIKYDHDKTAAAVISSNVELWTHKSRGGLRF